MLATDFSNIRAAYLAMTPTMPEDFPKLEKALRRAILDCRDAIAEMKKPRKQVQTYGYEAYDITDYVDRIEDALVDAYQAWLQPAHDRRDINYENVRQLVAQTAVDLHMAHAARRR